MKNPDAVSPASSKTRAERLRAEIDVLHSRAYGWARLGYFDHALVELREAETLSQLLGAGDGLDYDTISFETRDRVANIVARMRAHGETVKRFHLPEATLSDYRIIPLARVSERRTWLAVYTVPPETLTETTVASDPARYHRVIHIPGSRSFLAVLVEDAAGHGSATPVLSTVRTIEVPEGYTPYYEETRYGVRTVVVKMIGSLEQSVPGVGSDGAMVLCGGELLQLGGGSYRGPAIALPGTEKYPRSISALGTVTLSAVAGDTADAVLASYEDGRCLREVRFAGEQIIEIVSRPDAAAEAWDTLFAAPPSEPIDRTMAVDLAHWYALRHVMETAALAGDQFAEPTSVTRGKDNGWVVVYQRGSHAIAGSTTTVFLDEHGGLVRVHRLVTPR